MLLSCSGLMSALMLVLMLMLVLVRMLVIALLLPPGAAFAQNDPVLRYGGDAS